MTTSLDLHLVQEKEGTLLPHGKGWLFVHCQLIGSKEEGQESLPWRGGLQLVLHPGASDSQPDTLRFGTLLCPGG